MGSRVAVTAPADMAVMITEVFILRVVENEVVMELSVCYER